jgi:hypothetical protein
LPPARVDLVADVIAGAAVEAAELEDGDALTDFAQGRVIELGQDLALRDEHDREQALETALQLVQVLEGAEAILVEQLRVFDDERGEAVLLFERFEERENLARLRSREAGTLALTSSFAGQVEDDGVVEVVAGDLRLCRRRAGG